MTQITVELKGLESTTAVLEELVRRGEDATPLMQSIAFYGEQSTKERIVETNLAPDGQPWKPSRRAKAIGGKTLLKDRHLHDSIVSEATATEAVWGTNKIYGPIHQFGGVILPKDKKALSFPLPGGGFITVKKVTIPARPYLGLSDQNEVEITGLIEDYFTSGLVAA